VGEFMVEEIEKIKKKVVPVLKRYKAKRAGIFGSYARQEQTKTSDVDILVEISDKYSLIYLAKLKNALEKKLKKEVDLVEYGLLHPLIKKQVLKEEIKLYG
jgi:uncharacterized protein